MEVPPELAEQVTFKVGPAEELAEMRGMKHRPRITV